MTTDPYTRRFRHPKWSRTVTVLDVPALFRRLPEFADWTRARHAEVSAAYLTQAISGQRAYHGAVRRACETWGDHGPLVSGIVHDHFPDAVKEDLRTLNSEWTRHADMAHAHYVASGKRSWCQTVSYASEQARQQTTF